MSPVAQLSAALYGKYLHTYDRRASETEGVQTEHDRLQALLQLLELTIRRQFSTVGKTLEDRSPLQQQLLGFRDSGQAFASLQDLAADTPLTPYR